jgi:hypothetical protein
MQKMAPGGSGLDALFSARANLDIIVVQPFRLQGAGGSCTLYLVGWQGGGVLRPGEGLLGGSSFA